jgi:hypothetical protein
MSEPRASVVESLIKGVAEELTPEQYRAALTTATKAEKEAAARIMARTVVAPRTICDLTMREVWGIANIWEIARRWDTSLRPDATIGTLLKTIPSDQLESLNAVLVAAGFAHHVAAEEVPDDSDPETPDT